MSLSIKNRSDSTLSLNTIKRWQHLIKEYELIKLKQHPEYKFVTCFYKSNNLSRQNFIKYYNRYKHSNYNCDSLLPGKRGPKYKTRRTKYFIEEKVIMLRERGLNRYEISLELQESLKSFTPSTSTIYSIFKRNGLNRLKPKMQRNKRQIIKSRAGELGHIDCHYLPKGIIANDTNRYYLVAVIDSYSRVAWVKLIRDLKAINVMFATMKMLNTLSIEYGIKFEEVLTDNGSEFGSGPDAKNKDTHPFEVMLNEMKIKHRYTKPYRPQTNGKVERFWKTVNLDLLDEVVFDSFEHLEDEILQYSVYYNEARPHQAIDGKLPINLTNQDKVGDRTASAASGKN